MGRSRKELEYAIGRFESIGMTRNQALGALGSLAGESGRGLNTKAFNPKDPNGGSYGIGQWHSARKTNLVEFAKKTGKPVNDFKTQIDYIAHELTKTSEKKTLAKFKANPNMTLAQAAKTWTNGYERPNPKYAHHNTRAKNAQYFADVIGGKKVASVPDMSLTGATNVGGMVEGIAKGPTPEQMAKSSNVASAFTNPAARAKGLDAIAKMTSTLPSGAPDASRANMGGNAYATGQAGVPTPGDGGVARATKAGGDIVDGLSKVGDFFGGLATGGLSTADKVEDEADGFFGKPNTAAIVGTLAGGFFGGMPGALVGGMVGQAIGRSLGNVGSLFGGNQLNAGMTRDMFPDAPEGETRARTDYTKEDRDRMSEMSPGAAREISKGGSKGPAGLY